MSCCIKKDARKTAKLILTGNKRYITYMSHHLPTEHKKTRGHIKIIWKEVNDDKKTIKR